VIKYTLVPESFFSVDSAEAYLANVVEIGEKDSVRYKELPQYKAVLVYTGEGSHADDTAELLCHLVAVASSVSKYNKVIVHQGDDCVDIVIAAGEKLLLCNSFPSTDSVTSLYYLFASLKEFQINPEVTTVFFHGRVTGSMKSDAARYFSSIEQL